MFLALEPVCVDRHFPIDATHIAALAVVLVACGFTDSWATNRCVADRFSASGYEIPEGLSCLGIAVPAVSPDGVLYLPLQARSPKVGGTLVAVGPNGRVRPGWPVQLQRAGAAFWSVAVGSDGTAYALAIEPESSGTSSATILGIAPDSSVLYRTTIIDQ